LNACIDLLIERGFARLTVAEVAARAKLSLGAMTNYYRTKLDLVTAAAVYTQELSVLQADKLAKIARKSRAPVSAFVRHVKTFYLNRSYLALVELLIAARTDPDLAERFLPTVVSRRLHINESWLTIFVDAGLPERKAKEMLNTTLFLTRGMALAHMMALDREEIAQSLSFWETHLGGIVANEQKLAEQRRALRRSARAAATIPPQSGKH